MATERFANDIQTTLTSPVGASDAVIPIASGLGFPTQPQFRLRVDNEIMLVTGGVGTLNWDVTRGAENSTAASHANGATVVHVLTAGAMGVTSDPAAAVPGLRSLGTGATQAAAGTHAHAATDVTSGTMATARLGSGAASGSTYLRGDQTWATVAGGGGGGTSIWERSLATSPAAGAGSITLDSAPYFTTPFQGLIAIDPFTPECEIKTFSAVSGAVLTLGQTLAFSHASGDRVLFLQDDFDIPVTWFGAVHTQDVTAAVQAAVDQVNGVANVVSRPIGTGLTVHFPTGQYKIGGVVYVGSDTHIRGDGCDWGGTRILSSSTNAATGIFQYVADTEARVQNATRITIDGIQFAKDGQYDTTGYCIDMTNADECVVRDCSFGLGTNGCMNGIKITGGGVFWITNTRFQFIGNNPAFAGTTGQHQGTAGDNAAINVTGANPSDVLAVHNCQFEAWSKILLTKLRASNFTNCHMEYSALELHNSSHNTFQDMTLTATDVRIDNRSNDNLFENMAGVASRLVDLGSNTYRRVTGFENVGKLTRDFGPYNEETSPLRPDVIATDYSTDPAVAYGNPGDVILFCVHAASPSNATATTSTIRFVNTVGAAIIHTSPSFTLSYASTSPGIEQQSSVAGETITYWHMETVPAGGKIYIDSEFVCSVWASKVINPNPLLDSLVNWSSGGGSGGSFSATGTTTGTLTPSMSGTTYRIDWSAVAAGWSMSQYAKWPVWYSPRYLMVIRGRWDGTPRAAPNQNLAVQPLVLGDNTVHVSGDYARVKSKWKPGDETANLQTTDKIMFAVVQPGITLPAANRISNVKYLISSFGGYASTFTANTQIEIDWCGIVPLDRPPEADATQTYAATNVTTDRTYDANATSIDEVADVLGTLIADLRARGVVK